jgi:flagellar hook assembly protein FlgD
VPENMANQRVLLEIFNVLGQRVATLVNEQQPAGLHQINWNAESEGGTSLASGLYFYQLRVGDNIKTRRLTLLK